MQIKGSRTKSQIGINKNMLCIYPFFPLKIKNNNNEELVWPYEQKDLYYLQLSKSKSYKFPYQNRYYKDL
jgi:hypothetical protein